MTDFARTPSLLLKTGAATVRVVFWLLASAWIALAIVWGGLHFLIVPRIADLRPALEQRASALLGVTVRIGAIAARSNGLIPSFELRDITLLDAQGREALRLPSVVAALSPRSVVKLGFEQLYVESPVLDVRRASDGRVWVAGFALTGADTTNTAVADWVFSQTELVMQHGVVHWTDEMRGAPLLTLTDVDWVLRKQNRTHSMRLDADLPPDWGSRLGLYGIFKQPLLTRNAGLWREWEGQLYANLAQVDLAQLRRYADLGVDVAEGAGALRAWVDVSQGAVTGATADLALNGVNLTVDPRLQALTLKSLAGRLGAKMLKGGVEFSTQNLQFDTEDGLHWPGGNVRVGLFASDALKPAHGELVADRLDLAAMAQIVARLPLGDAAHAALQELAPKGLVEQVQGSWQGLIAQPSRFAAKGRVVQMALAAAGARPGFTGATIDFDVNQAGGKAAIAVQAGSADFPGIFEDPRIAFDQLAGDLQWKVDGAQISVSAPNVRFSNADAQGEVQIKWQTSAPVAGSPLAVGRDLGVLDLQGALSRADAARVHRYLPLELPKDVRDYVRAAVIAGTGSSVKFKVKGHLDDFPFATAKQGDFRISANVKDATFAYAPALVLSKDSLPWPALTQMSGELIIDRDVLQIKAVRANVGSSAALRLTKAEGVVNHLYRGATVSVNAEAQGPLADVLGVVNGSPLGDITRKVLAHASATGPADYRFKLALPIAAVDRATVQGTITLGGNDLQVLPETPRLTRARGVVSFSEAGFAVVGVQAKALGGDVRIDGGLSVQGGGVAMGTKGSPVLRMQGTASAEGLRQARELGFGAGLAHYATGSAAYTAVLGLRAGVPELLINSNLVGMALSLPAPMAKTADAPLALRLETSAVRSTLAPSAAPGGHVQDQIQLDVGRLASVLYVRDVSGPEARVLRGAIGVGLAADESAPLPQNGVLANVNMASLDLDAWSDVLSRASGADVSVGGLAAQNAKAANAAPPGMGYLPTTMAVRARELTLGGRKLNNVVVGVGREGALWRANLNAAELNGYIEYRQSSGQTPGRLYGRLAHLSIGQSTAQDVESLLDDQPASIPALDVVVDDFELRGKKLGRLEIDAVNLGSGAGREAAREWRLNRFNIITPEATLTAGGNWTNVANQPAAATGRSIKDRRRTALNFKLDINDSGELLQRFGMKGVIRKGRGKIEGQVAWMGSPITLDYPSLAGNFNVNVEEGQFLKADPGIAKLLGVLSLQSLPRRLALDFRDVFSEGFAFDFLRGDVAITQGIARTNNLQMKGVNAAVLMEGQADIAKETQSIKVVVVPEINAGSASLIASVINPVVGLTSFLAQLILRKPLIEAATQEFLIDGTWVDPRVAKVDHKPAKPK